MLSIGIDKPLPVLRSDIEIFSGPLGKDGSPVYVIHDPVTGSFSKIGWEEAMVLKRLRAGLAISSLLRDLNENTTLRVTSDDVSALCEEAERHGLTTGTLVKPAGHLLENVKTKQQSPLAWLARHYLYFRIPLIRPDRFLEKALPKARMLVSPWAKGVYGLLALMGFYFLTQRFESYVATFSYFYSAQGFIAFGAAIALLKTAHEFGHALVAKHYGLRVPTMGVAFMVFFPVAYSDVTDAWRLRRRGQRLQITLAGIQVELVVGAIALACWGVTPPGIVNSICFILSSTTLVSTLLVNLNPAMRYDGYYLLTDLWGIDNLSTESTQFTRWVLRRALLGLDAPCPASKVGQRERARMFLYALYSWHYRLFLYLGIAVVVYHKFTKPLGVALFAMEISLFIVRPVVQEINMLRKEKHRIHMNWRLALTMTSLLLLAGWAVYPLPRTAKAPAVYVPTTSQTIYAHSGGEVIHVWKRRGDKVAPGDFLLEIESSRLNSNIDYLATAVRQLRYTKERLNKSAERLGMVPEVEKQLASAEAELSGLMARKKQLIVIADMSGVLAELDDLLRPGSYVMENQVLGHIVALDKGRIDAFVSEKEIAYVPMGTAVTFFPADGSSHVTGKIERISPIREEYVDITDIGSVAAKELPLIKDAETDRMTFVESYYKVRIAPLNTPDSSLRLGTGGHIRFQTEAQSLALKFLQYAYSIFIRESGF